MKKIRLILIQIFLYFLLSISNSYGKALPPGSGVADVPANVLILLDRSGSMGATSRTGASLGKTSSIAPVSNTGNVISYDGNIFRGVDHDNNTLTPLYGTTNTKRTRGHTCSTYNNRGNNILYHNNYIYFIGGRSYSETFLYRMSTTNGKCEKLENFWDSPAIGNRGGRLLVSNNILILLSGGLYRMMYLRDLSTGADNRCNNGYSDLGNQQVYGNSGNYRLGATIDASSNLVVKSYESYQTKIKKYKLSGSTACPNTTSIESYTYPRFRVNLVTQIAAHPTDPNIIYGIYGNSLKKLTLSGSTITLTESVGRGGRLSANYNPTSKSLIRFSSPEDIRIDTGLNRIFIADSRNNMIQSFDLNLNFHDVSGYSVRKTRMQGAHEAIQSIVTDSSLISSVNFGFGYWSHDSSNSFYISRWKRAGYSRCRNYIGRFGITSRSWYVRYNYYCWARAMGGLGYTRWGNNQAVPCDRNNCLKVRVDRDGARRTNIEVKKVSATGGTDANTWATIATQYYNHSTDSPIDKNSPCQGSYVIVVGDGSMSNVAKAKTKVKNLLNQKKVKTFTVAYGGGISSSGLRYFNDISKAGGTERVIIADTPEALKAQLNAAIRSVIAEKLSFTAPAITATIEEGGSLFQAQFKYQQNKEWQGALTRTAISSDGVINTKDPTNWNASEKMPDPSARKIWGEIPGTNYRADYNNFIEDNSLLIESMFTSLGNSVGDYHNDTPTVTGVTGTTRCSNKGDSVTTIADLSADDSKGLINFARGQDYFDYDGDCILKEKRMSDGQKAYLGDVFHSEMVVVGAPSADTAYTSMNQEAYWRSINGYDTWKQSMSARPERIYVGGNDGMLHAIDSKTGVEKWAFIPPFIMGKLPLVVNTSLNNDVAKIKGGTNAIYGVDGSPVVHDIYFRSPFDTSKQWHTILMVPFGRGGNGFTVLDVTYADKPVHLYTIYNDHIQNKILHMDHLGTFQQYDYIDDTYSLKEMLEAIDVRDNYNNDNSVDETCDTTKTTSCYESSTWTFPLSGIGPSDLTVSLNGLDITAQISVQTSSSTGDSTITFPQTLFYQANPDKGQSPDEVEIKLSRSAIGNFSSNLPAEYNYKELGETWSAPRIIRLPNSGAGDNSIYDDIYVAVMGGGYGGRDDNVGSGLFVINLEDQINPGKVEKYIEIEDSKSLDIVNSVPGSPVVITADQVRGVRFKGALVYVNDFEGKITKINLTNMENDGAGNNISLYDSTTLLQIEASKDNGRYQFHSMDAGIGKTTKQLWLFSGTGDYERMTERTSKMDNLMYGFRDKDYPLYKQKIHATTLSTGLQRCMDTTGDTTGAKCPVTTGSSGGGSVISGGLMPTVASGNVSLPTIRKKDNGWYIKLPDSQKVTAEPTVSNGLVYFPIFEPSKSANKCSLGLALICAVDDECGKNVSSQLGNLKSQTIEGKVYAGKTCYAVGEGVLSRLVVFANKLFANIAGKSVQDKTDLVVIDTGMGDIESFRSSWREGNF